MFAGSLPINSSPLIPPEVHTVPLKCYDWRTLRVHLSHVQVHMQVSVNNILQLPFLQMYAHSYCLSFFASAYSIFMLAPAFFAAVLVTYFSLCPHLFPCSVLSSDVISKTSSAFLLTFPLLFSSILPTVALTTPASFHFSPVFPNMQLRKCPVRRGGPSVH